MENDRLQIGQLTTYQAGVIQAAAFRNIKRITDGILSEHSITTMQWFLIGSVLEGGAKGMRVTDLAATLGTTLAFVTTACNSLLERKILVKTSAAEDSRSKLVAIHPDYIDECSKIEENMRIQMRNSIYSAIKPAELLTYLRVLTKLQAVK